MAERLLFLPDDEKIVVEEMIEFKYYTGFSRIQKRKTIDSLHKKINLKYPDKKILEISSSSKEEIGVRLSAFNLLIYNNEIEKKIPVEVAFQSSKKFVDGGPYKDILKTTSVEAKKDCRLRESGELESFMYDGKIWPLEPKTFFYDYIYIKALMENNILSKKLLKYDGFTDIEFNHKKSINCQARAAAIYVSISNKGILKEVVNDLDKFKELYDGNIENNIEQLKFW